MKHPNRDQDPERDPERDGSSTKKKLWEFIKKLPRRANMAFSLRDHVSQIDFCEVLHFVVENIPL